MRILIILLGILLVVLQSAIWLDQDGYPKQLRLRDAVSRQQVDNNRLTERNQSLDAEVQDLKQGLDAIEERARSELGMIRQGETFYRIVDE